MQALLRDSARYAVMAVGMTFVIANKDIDLSVGSTYGLVAVVFSVFFNDANLGMGVFEAIAACLVLGTLIGLINGTLVTFLRVPAFIATLTMLLIGRGLILGLTGGRSVLYPIKARDYNWFFQLGETNAWGFNNQILIALVIVAGRRARPRLYALGLRDPRNRAATSRPPSTPASRRAGCASAPICCRRSAPRPPGLMSITQDKGVTAQSGLSAELIVIAAVIIGGASILGGRGRIIGSYLGALLVVLINKVLREGWPITRTAMVNGQEVQVQAVYTLPAGAVPTLIGALLIVAVLIEPYIIRRHLPQRIWARLRGLPPPPPPETGGVAIEGAQTKGSVSADRALTARGFGKFLARRDALAIMLAVVLWCIGAALRPDYWWNLPNTFALLLNYTEIALIAIGLTYVIAAGDIDLSVGSVIALAAGVSAYAVKAMGVDPGTALVMGLCAGLLTGVINGLLTVGFGLPAFIATLGTFYVARGAAAWTTSGQQLTGFKEQFNLIGRKIGDILTFLRIPHPPSWLSRRDGRVEHSDRLDGDRRDRCRGGARLHAVRPEALCNRRQSPGCGLCRHQHQARPVHRHGVLRALRGHGRHHQRRLFPQLQSDRRTVPRAGRDRGGHHRRRLDLRRLWHDHRRARRRSRHHPDPLAASAQRPGLHDAAALGQRLCGRHPDRRRAHRHLGAPAGNCRTDLERGLPQEGRAYERGRTCLIKR